MNIKENLGLVFHYWLIDDINYSEGYLANVASLKATVKSTQTGKEKTIYFNNESSLKDILLNIEH